MASKLPQVGDRVRFRALRWMADLPIILVHVLDHDREAAILASDYTRGPLKRIQSQPLDSKSVQMGEIVRVDNAHGYMDIRRRGVPQTQ